MRVLLLLVLAVATYLPQLPIDMVQQKNLNEDLQLISDIAPVWQAGHLGAQSIMDIDEMLHHESPGLHQQVIDKVLKTLKCIDAYHVAHNHILTVIDYSLPSNEKRLWVFDLKEKKLLFNTYVSHGIKSGALISNYFSNKNNSKASSIGVYQTQEAYYGRDGLSLRLDGLDSSFNDNAANRAVVMHSGWYVEEWFIKKYGRPGRSWGCPALPLENSNEIINTIKDKSLLVIYYPSDTWFSKSKFLNCDKVAVAGTVNQSNWDMPAVAPDDQREAILFIGSGYKGKRAETNPVAVISADKYQGIFHTTPPLKRMLRRQINHEEYVALSALELNYLANNTAQFAEGLNIIYFVIPQLKVVRGGYYETQMEVVPLGKIKEVKNQGNNSFTVHFENSSVMTLNASDEFIRWVGL